jgi:CheY-like chemotaxis protein
VPPAGPPRRARAYRESTNPLEPEILHPACWRALVQREALVPPPTVPPGRPRRILVVDDDAAFRQTIRELLEAQAFDVEEVGSGREALAACRQGRVALVIADIVMPDVDGLELLRTLRRRDPALPIVVVTGSELRGTPPGTLDTMATRLGARAVFRKPLVLDAFVQVVRTLAQG